MRQQTALRSVVDVPVLRNVPGPGLKTNDDTVKKNTYVVRGFPLSQSPPLVSRPLSPTALPI